MHIISAQVLSLTCLFASMIGVFLLPYWWLIRRPDSFGGSRYHVGLSLANCLSGGVFIATFFVGLMPEVRELFDSVLQSYKIKSEFPVTEFVIFLGFLLSLGIEQYVLDYQEKKTSRYTSIPSGLGDDISSKTDTSSNSMSVNADRNDVTDCESERESASKVTAVILKENSASCFHDVGVNGSKCHDHAGGHSHTDIGHYLKGEAGIRLGMLMVSLGVHSLFEGLALGLQTVVPVLINLVIGVAVHELLVSFAMGVNVSRLKLPTSTAVKLAIVFSVSIPVGQLIGLLIGHYQSTAGLTVSAILQGLAAGTFIHVTFLEVIPAEFQEPGLRILKVFFLGLGFMLLLLCTVAMQTIISEKH